MTDFDAPIVDLHGAEAYFRAMGCSHFHMSREYPKRYNEYQSLGITKSQETEWTEEELEELHLQASNRDAEAQILWEIHSCMEDLVRILKTVSSLECIHDTTVDIEQRLPPRGKMLVAETINGRQDFRYRGGLIFLAYDIGRKDIAESFANLSARLSESALKHLGSESDRCRKAYSDADAIRNLLKI